MNKVLGASFAIGGLRYRELSFNDTVAQTMSSLMFVATGSLILPSAFEAALTQNPSTQEGVLALSRGTAIVMLTIYILYLVFQLKTHAYLFEAASSESDSQDDGPQVAPWAAGITLLVTTMGVSFCSDYLVDSIDEVVESCSISKTFIGLILLPIVGNAGHLTV